MQVIEKLTGKLILQIIKSLYGHNHLLFIFSRDSRSDGTVLPKAKDRAGPARAVVEQFYDVILLLPGLSLARGIINTGY